MEAHTGIGLLQFVVLVNRAMNLTAWIVEQNKVANKK